MNMSLLWDALKLEIKEKTIKYCKNKANLIKSEINKMENDLKTLIERYNENESNFLLDKINILENKIEKEYEYKAKGAQIRSKQIWIEQGEKNNAYFLGLEKSRQTKKTILKLKDEKGNIVTDQEQIIKIERSFYEKLYSEDKEDNLQTTLEYVNNTKLKHKLTKEESKSCDGYVTLEETTEAINNLKLNKSPGIDGLSTNFYKQFWDILGPILVKVFNQSYDSQKLPFSQRQSILNLIYKKK